MPFFVLLACSIPLCVKNFYLDFILSCFLRKFIRKRIRCASVNFILNRICRISFCIFRIFLFLKLRIFYRNCPLRTNKISTFVIYVNLCAFQTVIIGYCKVCRIIAFYSKSILTVCCRCPARNSICRSLSVCKLYFRIISFLAYKDISFLLLRNVFSSICSSYLKHQSIFV